MISYLKVIVTDPPRLSSWVFQIIIHKTVGELSQNQNLLLTFSQPWNALALLGLITDRNDRFSYPYTSTSEKYTLSYTWILKNVLAIIRLYPTGNFTPLILKSTSWVKLSWWKFLNTFVRLFQSSARNQALAKSTKMFRVSTVWVVQPAIRLSHDQAFFSFWHFYCGQGRTAWSQVTVTRASYFSGAKVVKFLIDLCNTWRYLLLPLLIINRAWPVPSE